MKRGGLCWIVAPLLSIGCFRKSESSSELPASQPAVAAAAVQDTKSTDRSGIANKEWGSIKGRLVWGKSELPMPVEHAVLKDKSYCCADGPLIDDSVVVDRESLGLKNVIVFVRNPPAIHPTYPQTKEEVEKSDRAQFFAFNGFELGELERKVLDKSVEVEDIRAGSLIRITRCRYDPHAIAVREGQLTLILSSDPIAHNSKVSSFKTRNSMAGMIFMPGSVEKFHWVADPQPLTIECSIHGWMKMFAMVFDHPYFATTANDGSFELKNVPARELNLMIRSPLYIGLDGKKGTAKGSQVIVKANEVLDLGDIKVTAID